MTQCSVTTVRDASNTGIWYAKCYKDGNLVHTETVHTAKEAQLFADHWLADQVDNNSVD